jgi:hypothetical protein
VKAVNGVMGIVKRQMARSETGMVYRPVKAMSGVMVSRRGRWRGLKLAWYRPVKAARGVMGTAKRQMARSETGMLQTCEGSEWGDGNSEEADGEV